MTDSAPVRAVRRVLCDWRYFPYLATAILVCDAIANIILIRVAPMQPDTEWETYMAHGAAFLRGERDYAVLRGDSARAVGPAGYVYLCAALHRLTAGGAHLVRAQALWAVLYSATQALAFALLARTRIAPPWAALVLAASRQLHRLYVLRLGDDCWATLLALGAAVLLAHDRWAAGTALYCAAAGVSLAVLHYLPGLVCLLVQRRGLARAAACLAAACAAQLVAAAPFLAAQPAHYLGAVFDVARRLPHVLSVNWRFVPPSLVLSRGFAAALNACHAFLLAYLAVRRWWPRVRPTSFFADYGRPIPPQDVVMTLFTSNYVGIVFSPHIEQHFYTWFFHSLPFLAWTTPYVPAYCLAVLANIELTYNTVPVTPLSSLALFGTNLLLGWVVVKYYKDELDIIAPYKRAPPTASKAVPEAPSTVLAASPAPSGAQQQLTRRRNTTAPADD